jgi:alpha-L-arabinofuranosidase
MSMIFLTLSCVIGLLGSFTTAAAAEPNAHVTVHADQPGMKISPLLYGIFFEEINRAGEGGLYAEMLQNRSFEDAATPIGWTLLKSPGDEAAIALDTSRPLNANNPTCLKLSITKAAGRVGICNEGFKGACYGSHDQPGKLAGRFREAADAQTSGLFVEKDKEYVFSMYVRGDDSRGPVTVTIEKADGTPLAQGMIAGIGSDWKKFELLLTAAGTDTNARLVIRTSAPGTLCFDMVSLFPKDSFHHRPNGMRKDLAQMIADMHPAFIRFPGGCFVEGDRMAEAFRWKKTIGDVAQRPGHYNLWGYRSNDGLGYHEYLQFCEDVGAEPLFVINCGMAHKDHVPMDKMDEYVQDALDAVEYANGPPDSKWGARRAKAGHPAPFHLGLMEIGNENGGPLYHERYALFYEALKKRYPELRLVACLWKGMPTNRPVEILDEHYYDTPEFFFAHSGQYESYDRAGHKVYVGEYAVTQGAGSGNLIAAVGEAAFMTGLERNGDVVAMASYAPLLVDPHWKRWNPNAIVFDSARAYGTPSYHVQAMFAAHRADRALPATVEVKDAPRSGMIGVGTWLTQAEFKDIRVTKDGETLFASDFGRGLKGWKVAGGQWAARDGALCQSGDGDGVRALAGGIDWTDYTLTLKARKTGGAEGFLILFTNQNSQEKYWWNIGGWGNTRHALEGAGLPEAGVKGRIETGRWYDIKVALSAGKDGHGPQINCYLDNRLIHSVRRKTAPTLFATAGLSAAGDELILKVVNGGKAMATQVSLKGLKQVESKAQAIELTGDSPADENSFESPARVAPQHEVVEGVGPEFQHVFPACSVTILRLKLAR